MCNDCMSVCHAHSIDGTCTSHVGHGESDNGKILLSICNCNCCMSRYHRRDTWFGIQTIALLYWPIDGRITCMHWQNELTEYYDAPRKRQTALNPIMQESRRCVEEGHHRRCRWRNLTSHTRTWSMDALSIPHIGHRDVCNKQTDTFRVKPSEI